MYCDWGDESDPHPNHEPFAMVPENTTYHIIHEYKRASVFNFTCTLYNMVTSITFNKTVTIMMKIQNFTAEPLYVPAGKDQDVDEPQQGLGDKKDQFPIDRNITFFFDYMQGTIEYLTFYNYSSPEKSVIANISVEEEGGDIYDVLNFRYSIPFPYVSD